jgi:Cys-rich repeat protein
MLRFLVPVVLVLVSTACSHHPIGKSCAVITDCALGEQCVDGHCSSGGEGEEGEGEGAGEGEGTAGEGEGEGGGACVSDANCPAGDVCSNGICVGNTGSCTTSAQCNPGFICVGGICETQGIAGCHSDAECAAGTSCISPDNPQCGGAPPPPPPPNVCTVNTDCGTGQVCDFVAGFCGSGQDQCVAACATDADCVAGKETCNTADGGRCEAISCTNGFTCPTWTACGGVAPDPLSDDSKHGCIPISCTIDTDCPPPVGAFVAIAPSGHCIDGVCASGPGQCEAPVP